MQIGVVKEIKDNENRVALTPQGAARLVEAGHRVRVERGAGAGCGFTDAAYQEAGADLVGAAKAWDADLVVKVKEPQANEYGFLRDQILFTYLHLAGVARSLTEVLLEKRTTAIAYETVEDAAGRRPLLAPMSAVAGSMATLMGAYYLAKFNDGRGMLLGNILGERYGKVVIVGDGVVGQHAARVACAMGAEVVMFGITPDRSAELQRLVSPDLEYLLSTEESLSASLRGADLLVGAVLIEGARAPRVVSEAMVKSMPAGSVIVDVSIDQGGCIATSRPTSHSHPVFVQHGVVHYCVTNMPGAYPRTSTFALTGATLPYLLRVAAYGVTALAEDRGFAHGVNTHDGYLTCLPVARAFGLESRYRGFHELVGRGR
jgi:alanine dehydrogenase